MRAFAIQQKREVSKKRINRRKIDLTYSITVSFCSVVDILDLPNLPSSEPDSIRPLGGYSRMQLLKGITSVDDALNGGAPGVRLQHYQSTSDDRCYQ